MVFPFLEVGGVGGICVHTHVVGPQVKEMITRYKAGDVDGARALDEELRPAIEILQVQTNPIAIKRALQLLGHEVGGLRLPLVEADEAETAQIRDCLERLGLLTPSPIGGRRRRRGRGPPSGIRRPLARDRRSDSLLRIRFATN